MALTRSANSSWSILVASSAADLSRRASASDVFSSSIWPRNSHNSSPITSDAIKISRSSPTWPNFRLIVST
ncbi:hypothetical protein AUC69_14040 [Methyloceanibacter superfactus]|uniref:Uncharacterized protein n=1 Tax=Methyloceanibacter superfactus TaxID=1774969 RepID=A0A1E3VT59_9HYPH|nr:hypothetical protein AUC69_14040 [Methyloceanibacter superfactus]